MVSARTVLAGLVLGTLPLATWAQCAIPDLASDAPAFSADQPAPPDVALRPELPDCLRDLSGPEQENCPRDVIDAYGAAVAAYIAALQAYVTETNAYANAAARFANAAIDHAEAARSYADGALGYADCEAEAIRSRSR